jgi:hypothetical protein
VWLGARADAKLWISIRQPLLPRTFTKVELPASAEDVLE